MLVENLIIWKGYCSAMKRQLSMKAIRFVLILFAVGGFAIVSTAFSLAWYTGVTTNKNNRMTTGMVSAKLLTTNRPVQVVSTDGSVTTPPKPPQTTGELFLNDNSLIILDDDGNGARKFFEMNGKNEIVGVSPNFRMQRPLIVTNESDAPINYSIDFICREVKKQGLGSSTFFNYTKLGDDIPNENLVSGDKTEIKPQTMVENLALNISKIGEGTPINLGANSSHIYIIDMGVLPTAGSATQGAGIEMDIILATSQGVNTVHSISDQATFEKAIVNNKGGETFMLTKSVTINKQLRSNNVFNLDLNGYTLAFDVNGMLDVFYPITQASMDIGSEKGGNIVNANSITFVGHQNKSALNWYTDITGVQQPTVCTNVLVRQRTVEHGNSSNTSSQTQSQPSSELTSSTDEYLPEYKDYETITIAQGYESGNGTRINPYVISTIEQFKYFIEDDSVLKNNWYQLTQELGNIKNAPDKLMDKQANITLVNNARIKNIDVVFQVKPQNPNLTLSKLALYEMSGTRLKNEDYINNITYRVR